MTANQRALYEDHGPAIANCAIYAYTTSGSNVTIAEWPLCRNVDDQPVKTWILWQLNGSATGTATIEITDGSSSDTATATTTSTSAVWSSISVTPSSSTGSPRTVRLQLKTSAATVFVYSITSHVDPGSVNGIQSSGYAPTPEKLYASNEPVSSERYWRLADGPVWTDRDRARALYCVLDDFTAVAARAMMTTTSANGVTVNKGTLSTLTPPGAVRVSAYLERDGSAAAQVSVEVGGSVVQLSGTGWQHANLEIGIGSGQVRAVLVNTGGAGNVFLRGLVITRGLEP
tara:strand:- start:2955 stop:3815 length:861 start_codon:yes stop_codon:yes gene_type:complete